MHRRRLLLDLQGFRPRRAAPAGPSHGRVVEAHQQVAGRSWELGPVFGHSAEAAAVPAPEGRLPRAACEGRASAGSEDGSDSAGLEVHAARLDEALRMRGAEICSPEKRANAG